MSDKTKAERRGRTWSKAGQALKTLRNRRGLTQWDVVEEFKKATGNVVFRDDRHVRMIEIGDIKVKSRRILLLLMAKVFEQEEISVFNDILAKYRYDRLSKKEIEEFALQSARAGSQSARFTESPSVPPLNTQDMTPVIPAKVVAHPSQGLIARYLLAGNAKDQSGNENHGTVCGGVRFIRKGDGQVAEFDGSSGYVSIADRPALRLEQFTVAAWVYLRKTKGRRRIIQKGKSYYFFMYHDRPLIGLWNEDGIFDLTSSTQVKMREWHFMTGTFDNRVLRFYFDGVCVDIRDFPTPVTPEHNREPLIVGWKYNGTKEDYFAGKMRDVVIYNRALTNREIYDLYIAGRSLT